MIEYYSRDSITDHCIGGVSRHTSRIIIATILVFENNSVFGCRLLSSSF